MGYLHKFIQHNLKSRIYIHNWMLLVYNTFRVAFYISSVNHLGLDSFCLLLEIDSNCATTCIPSYTVLFTETLCAHVHNCCALVLELDECKSDLNNRSVMSQRLGLCSLPPAFLFILLSSSILYLHLVSLFGFKPQLLSNAPHFLLQSHPHLFTGEQIKNIWKTDIKTQFKEVYFTWFIM